MGYRGLVVLAVAGAVGVGCNGSTGPASSTFLRSVNASPNAPPLDVYVYGSRIVINLPYATTTSYISIGSGPATVSLVATGDSQSILSTPTQFLANHSYTLLIVGPLTMLRSVILTDSTTAPPDSARLRLVNTSVSTTSVDVYVKPLGDSTPLTPTFTGVAFASATPYISTQAMPQEVVVTKAGSKTVVVDDSLTSMPTGTVQTVVVLDHSGGGAPLTALNLANPGT
jgi:hypothetical protein